MAISGVFSDGFSLLDQPWFDGRWRKEQGVFTTDGYKSSGLVEWSDLGISMQFSRPHFLSFNVILESRRHAGQYYGAEIVLPGNWPWGEPVSYAFEPRIGF